MIINNIVFTLLIFEHISSIVPLHACKVTMCIQKLMEMRIKHSENHYLFLRQLVNKIYKNDSCANDIFPKLFFPWYK